MVEAAKISLWGEPAGAVTWDEKRSIAFVEFFPSFSKKSLDISPIHIPIRQSEGVIYSFPELNRKTFHGLPGLLSDSLPDDFGNRVINSWFKQNNIEAGSFTPVDRLCYIGQRGMGALEYEPAFDKQMGKATELDVEKLVYLASKIVSDRSQFPVNIDHEQGLDDLIKVGTSAGGQRAKAIIAFNEKTNEVRSGQVAAPDGFSYWIMKFDGASNRALGDPDGYGLIEYAYYLMAKSCGIDMMESRLFHENKRSHFMTKRFDRTDSFEKIHVQTLCALAHFDFNRPGQYSYEDAFRIMRKLRLPHTDAAQLFRRMVFNIIARNQDDHTKNISFMMDKSGEWKLAPAYDMIYAYNPEGTWTGTHQMSINGKTDGFLMNDLLQVAKDITIKKGKEIINEIRGTIRLWPDFAAEAGVTENQAIAIEKTFRLNLE